MSTASVRHLTQCSTHAYVYMYRHVLYMWCTWIWNTDEKLTLTGVSYLGACDDKLASWHLISHSPQNTPLGLHSACEHAEANQVAYIVVCI